MNKIKESLNKLSSREKVLIYILVILLILCFGWLILLQPQLNNNSTLQSEKEAYELQLNELQSNSLTTNETVDIVKLNQQVKELSDQLYNKMTKEDIDKLVTELATTHHIVPKTLSMSEITQTDLSSSDSSSESTNTSDDSSSNKKSTDSSSASVYTCTVQQTCTGTQAQLEKLFDDVKAMNGIYIASVSYQNGTGNLDLSITYTIYMIEK
ncbi:type II secretion system protein GspM [Faecalibacillus faecis]|uniref:type II secretion system protein GspM n=1 Tax=Faecalibacillus faecis TaxID=1982628 RepID=UPI002F9437FE